MITNCEYLNTSKLYIPSRLGMSYAALNVFKITDSKKNNLFTVAVDANHAKDIGRSNGLVEAVSIKSLDITASEYQSSSFKLCWIN